MHFNWGHITRFSFLIFVLMIVIPACKDDFNSSIPYTRVYIPIDLSRINDLTVTNNSWVFPQGFGGVIVTNYGAGYYAMDAACPYEVDPQCRVEFDQGSATATCPCCGSQYLLIEGGLLLSGTGPSIEPLKPYKVKPNGFNTLLVTN